MSDDVELDYEYLMQNAMRYLMRDVLQMVADLGDAPGDHHFYIEFLTSAPGVSVPDYLLEAYPTQMTVVLQHQFEDLVVTDKGFSVTLWFKGKEANLKIPFDAIVSFADPSAKFGLRFGGEESDDETPQHSEAQDDVAASDERSATDEAEKETAEPAAEGGADVVSLDAFRKK